jgi:hypothetical protein
MSSALIWDVNWAWSLPLVIFTVIFHATGLSLISRGVSRVIAVAETRRHLPLLFSLVMGVATLLATLLHASEASLWAFTYWILGAIPNGRLALLYSLNAITSYGHTDVYLATHWQLMGAIEALNGLLLFGLTTAFLYGVVRRAWPLETRVTAAGRLVRT